MFDTPIRYLASVFVNGDNVKPDVDDMTALAAKFQGVKFAPEIIEEPTPPFGMSRRVGFRTIDAEWRIAILGLRVDVVKAPVKEKGENLGRFDEFCKASGAFLSQIIAHYQVKAHRLAAVQNGVLREMSASEFSGLASRLLRFPEFYQENLPFEWDWRCAALLTKELCQQAEPTNFITTAKKVQSFVQIPFGSGTFTRMDRVQLEFDTNTNPSNTSERFEERHIDGFFHQAGIWHRELMDQMSVILDIESME